MPIMPANMFADIFEQFGEETASMAFDNVENGIWTVDEVQDFMDRPDIEPDDWEKFEEGWRPNNW